MTKMRTGQIRGHSGPKLDARLDLGLNVEYSDEIELKVKWALFIHVRRLKLMASW
jgi:hypothetical protein